MQMTKDKKSHSSDLVYKMAMWATEQNVYGIYLLS